MWLKICLFLTSMHGHVDLADFGSNIIDCLTSWFKPTLQKAGCDVDSNSEEWFSLKILVNTTFLDKDYTSL